MLLKAYIVVAWKLDKDMEKNLPRKQNTTIKTTTNKIENVIDNEHSIFLFSETKQDDLARKEMGHSSLILHARKKASSSGLICA